MHISKQLIAFAHRTLMLALAALSIALVALTPTLHGATPAFKVLIFKNTPALERFHADSVAAGIAAIKQMGTDNGFEALVTDKPTDFNSANLAQYRAVIFLSPEGQTLNATQQSAFQSYIEGGGGYVGVHGAMYMQRTGWDWYRQLVGATPLGGGPPIDEAVVRVINKNHPSTANLPDAWTRTDEWYGFQSVSANVTVLANVDENTYDPDIHEMGNPHPIAWYHSVGSGRSWYTGGGHYAANWNEPLFLDHVLGGILWAANPPSQPTPTATVTRTLTPTATTPTATTTPGLARRGYVPLALK